MSRAGWDIVPQTLKKIREWTYCDAPEDLAEKIVYGFVSDKIIKKKEEKHSSKKGQLEEWVARIKDFEQGKRKPTLNQLKKIAETCFVPYSYFLKEFAVVEKHFPKKPIDFRKAPKQDIKKKRSEHPLIFEAFSKQRAAKDFILNINPNYRSTLRKEQPGSLPSVTITETESFVQKIGDSLGLDFAQWRNLKVDQRLTELKRAITKKNILLIINEASPKYFTWDKEGMLDGQGMLGKPSLSKSKAKNPKKNPEENIPSIVKGFAFYDEVVPLIVLNETGYQGDGEKIFTLIHELAHLYIKRESVLNFSYFEENDFQDSVAANERFCNMVAEECVLPASDFHKIWNDAVEGGNDQQRSFIKQNQIDLSTDRALADFLNKLASKSRSGVIKNQGISKWVFLYRAYHLGKLSQCGKEGEELSKSAQLEKFRAVRQIFFNEWMLWKRASQLLEGEATEAKEKEEKKSPKRKSSSKKTGVSYGHAETLQEQNGLLCGLALQAWDKGKIDILSLKEILGLKSHSDLSNLQSRMMNE